MKKTVTVTLSVTLLIVGLVACTKKTKAAAPLASPSAAAGVSCEGKLTKDPTLELPKNLPTELGLILTGSQTAGTTKIYFGALEENDLLGARDDLSAKLVAAGYKLVGKDQEPGVEAEAQFEGPHAGTLRTRNLCAGFLEVRYRIDS